MNDATVHDVHIYHDDLTNGSSELLGTVQVWVTPWMTLGDILDIAAVLVKAWLRYHDQIEAWHMKEITFHVPDYMLVGPMVC